MLRKIVDSIVETFSPARGLARLQARATIDQIETFTGAAGHVGYESVAKNRLNKIGQGAEVTENTLPGNQFTRLRWLAWQLYRNNPQARKIVSSLESKIVGRGNSPQSLAAIDGEPHQAFRTRAEELWKASSKNIDVRGAPGRGGQTLGALQRSLIRNTVLSGEVLARLVSISPEEAESRRMPIPLQIQLIHAHRLADDLTDDETRFRGIEFDENDRRVKYHIRTGGVTVNSTLSKVTPVPADEILHLYLAHDVDQIRGTTWFAPVLSKMRDVTDYEFHEMQAAKMAACVVLAYSKSSGQNKFGLNAGPGQTETDQDDNPIDFIQSGMVVDLGVDGKLDSFNPLRPNDKAVEFLNHIIRSEAAGVGGTKASTVTGDYRGASFTSERSNDNDIWPEILAFQDWFNESFNQPLFAAIVDAGILAGWFDDVIPADAYQANRHELLRSQWSGPVQPAINPKDEVVAAQMRVAAAISTPQIEAAALGRNWEDVLADVATFIERAKELGLPDSVINSYTGQTNNGNSAEAQSAAIAAQAAAPAA